MKVCELQKWLGSLIRQPLAEDECLPLNTVVQELCARHITPSKTLKPYERVQIYHRQYWWRLINCLMDSFPMVLRLFGKQQFQQLIAIPFLTDHPPTSWALAKLGACLPNWLETCYQAKDRPLVISSAEIDWAASKAFWIKADPKPDFADCSQEQTLSLRLGLQSHISLFSLEADFFSFREELLLNEPDYYNHNPFPSMSYGRYHFALYRTPKNGVTWTRLTLGQFWVLSRFQEGCTIEELCLELDNGESQIKEEALARIPFWFKEWTVVEWFRLLLS